MIQRLSGDVFSVIYCAKLPAPLNGALSTDETVYDTLVVVECHIGFKHVDGRTAKTVLCLDNTTWNDTDIDCQGLVLGAHISSDGASNTLYSLTVAISATLWRFL